MSGNIDSKDEKVQKKVERDLSPSAHSQSSAGLEWDPSADVGTSTAAHDQIPRGNLENRLRAAHFQSGHKAGGRGNDQTGGALKVAGNSSARPRISRSRSYEYPTNDAHDINQSQHKSSMAELSNQPTPSVQSSVKESQKDNFLDTMAGGFLPYKRKTRSVFPSKSATVPSILPSSSQANSSQMMASGYTSDTKSIQIDTPAYTDSPTVSAILSPRPHSGTETTSPNITLKDLPSSRSHSMHELASHDSTTAPTAIAGSDASKYLEGALSAFCTDGSRQKHDFSLSRKGLSDTHISGSTNDRSAISEWLEVGMTRSEKELQKFRNDEKLDSGGSSSMIFVEIRQNLDHKNQAEQTSDSDGGRKNIGIQTSHHRKNSSELVENASGYSSIYHSTPTDPHRSRLKGMLQNRIAHREDGNSKPKSGARDKRRERSPPQPFAVASRRSSQRHHHAHHSRAEDVELSSYVESHESAHKATRSSSDLSPPCFLINKLAKTGHSPVKKEEMLSAIEMHRDYHVKKVRHELKQLEKLNRLLSHNLVGRNRLSSNSSENEVHRKHEKVHPTNIRRKLSPAKPREISVKPKKPEPDQHSQTSDYSSSTSNTTMKDSSSRESKETYVLLKSTKAAAGLLNNGDRNKRNSQDGEDPLERKLDQLIDTFTYIAEMMIDNKENIPVSKKTGVGKKSKKPKPKKIEPIKPPVAYFIPFPNCEGQYIFRKTDLDLEHSNTSAPAQQERKIDSSSKTIFPNPLGEDGSDDEESNSDSVEDNVGDENQEPFVPVCGRSSCPAMKYTLQDAFQCRHPTFINRLQEREAVLARLKLEREIRAEKKREWIRQYGENCQAMGFDNSLPPKGPRLMTTREMRKLTERNYKKLPEVRERVLQRKAEEEKKTNRIMSQVFADRLRKGVLKGEVNFVHSRSLIRR